jgi:transposase
MAIVHQKDKRSGITYAYESTSYWVKELKQSRSKRVLIGRVDDVTGEIIPTDGRGRNKSVVKSTPEVLPKRSFYGATYLFDCIGKRLGITSGLKTIFGESYRQILSIVYFLLLEDRTPLSRFTKWSDTHHHPFGKDIPSQRSSELFAAVEESHRQQFFSILKKRKADGEYWAYDTTSISSYSQQLKQVKYGKNKEHDRLPQINLALVFGSTSQLPYYYRQLAGNIPDSKTLSPLLSDLRDAGYEKVSLVLDRGFYSKENIDALYKEHLKFLMSVSMGLKFLRNNLEPLYDGFRSFDHYNSTYELYCQSVLTSWNYEQARPYKNDVISEERRIYIHYFFNIDKAAEDEKAFDLQLITLRSELESEKRVAEHEKQYKKYFTITSTPKRGTKAAVIPEAVAKAKRYHGFFALISNQKMDAIEALQLYRNKDVVEKAFNDLKDRLGMRRTLVSSQKSLEGKLFIQFIALIYISYIKKKMQDGNLFSSYSIQSLLDTLDVIDCVQMPGKRLRCGELLEKQKVIYEKLGFSPPSSL